MDSSDLDPTADPASPSGSSPASGPDAVPSGSAAAPGPAAERRRVDGPALARAGITVVVTALTLLGVLVGALRDGGEGDDDWVLAAVSLLVGVALLVVVIGNLRRPGPWVLAGGTLVVAFGSGTVRPRTTTEDPFDGGGDIVATLQRSVPLVVVGLIVVVVGIVLVVRDRSVDAERPPASVRALGGFVPLVVGLVAMSALLGDIVVATYVVGRPLRRRGRRAAPPSPPGPSVDGGGAGSAAWRAAALDEAASIAAFEDLATRLAEVGAPDELVRRAHRAAADEARHAPTCTAIADRLAPPGAPRPPRGPDACLAPPSTDQEAAARLVGPARTVAIARLAVESLVDGAIGEGAAAGRLRSGAATIVGVPGALLRAMAEDEARHAALGLDVVRWCRTQHPRIVDRALATALRRLPTTITVPPAEAALSPDVARAAGLADAATARALWSATVGDARAALALPPAASADPGASVAA